MSRLLRSFRFVRMSGKPWKQSKDASRMRNCIAKSSGDWPILGVESMENVEFIPDRGFRLPGTVHP